MEYVDIESFRSKYSDLTVTAVPSGSKQNDEQQQAKEQMSKTQDTRVEITRIPGGGASGTVTPNPVMTTRHRSQQSAAALNYANEYKEVLAKLEYTKYMQAQLQLMILANGPNSAGGDAFNDGLFGLLPTSIAVDEDANIDDKYSNLLNILAGMRTHLAPTLMGVRAGKDCLLRDIAKARLIVRECLLLLESDQQKQSEENQCQGSPASE